MTSIKLLSFDLDDTLWPCKPTIAFAEAALYTFLQNNVPLITRQLSVLQIQKKRMEFLNQHKELEHDLSELRIQSLEALSAEFSLENKWVDEAFHVFYEARQKVTLFDDVAVVLDELKPHYRMVAVSNGNADIEKTGVGHWFEFAVSASDVGYIKPHPAVFESVCTQSGCTVDEIVHIGDHPHHDIYAANLAGIRSVWLNRRCATWQHHDCQADFHIKSLTELPSLLIDL